MGTDPTNRDKRRRGRCMREDRTTERGRREGCRCRACADALKRANPTGRAMLYPWERLLILLACAYNDEAVGTTEIARAYNRRTGRPNYVNRSLVSNARRGVNWKDDHRLLFTSKFYPYRRDRMPIGINAGSWDGHGFAEKSFRYRLTDHDWGVLERQLEKILGGEGYTWDDRWAWKTKRGIDFDLPPIVLTDSQKADVGKSLLADALKHRAELMDEAATRSSVIQDEDERDRQQAFLEQAASHQNADQILLARVLLGEVNELGQTPEEVERFKARVGEREFNNRLNKAKIFIQTLMDRYLAS